MNNLIKDKKLMTADCFTTQQKQVIEEKNKNLLVSASAGTGKTTVMIERIVNLIKTNAIDVSDIIVVTFTELAAAEMKQRLLLKLLECKEDERVYEQLEKLDMCSISTLHAFCLNILKNYFYLADLDPNFSVLDDVTGCKLKNSALTSTLSKFKENDDVFGKVFHIFEQGRSDETLRAQILSLYSYYCANDNFDEWYASIRENYFNCNDNTYEQLLNATLCEEFKAISDDFASLAVTAKKYGSDKLATYCESLSSSYTVNSAKSLYDNVACLYSTEKDSFISSLKKYSDKFCVSEQEFSLLVNKIDREKKSAKCRSDDFINMISPYTKQDLREKTFNMLPYVDKLVEVMRAFGQEYAENKKQRGMVDFNDMEKFALVVLQNPQANAELKEKYKMIFVDEYQDINPIQEKIICLLSSPRNAFMVGDTKQSIFGFRGCDSTIFTQRYETYSTNEDDNLIVGLNSNFRSDKVILDFVNTIFSNCMTKSFGNLDYKKYAMLRSSFSDKQKFPTVTIDALPRIEKEKIDNATSYYDFTEDNVNNNLSNNSEATREGILIAKRIKQLIGSRIFHRGEERTIKYSDIVILSRNLTEKAKQIYNELVRQHIPVSVNLKSNTVTKEIADLINLLRAVDNPYIDKYIVSVCLSFFGKMTTEEVSKIKIATTEDICFYDRLLHYVSRNDEVAKKIDNLLTFLSSARLLANSMTVDKLLLNITSTCNYYLYVAGLPNGEYRLSRMYTFIESIKSTEFALSISKFLSQIDISFSNNVNCADTDAVRFLTIHNCKGLEFPIVFLCNTSCVYQQNNNIMGIDKNIGLTLAYYDFDTLTKSPSLASIARNIVETKKRNEEELRLLYVALTRAKNYLFFVCLRGGNSSKTTFIAQDNSYSKLVLDSMTAKYGALCSGLTYDGVNYLEWNESDLLQETLMPTDKLIPLQSNDKNILESAFLYRYKYKYAEELPTKLVSSSLSLHSALPNTEEEDIVDTSVAYIGTVSEEDIFDAIPSLDTESTASAPLITDNDMSSYDFASATQQVSPSSSTFLGTAYHKLYERCPLHSDETFVAKTLTSLTEEGIVLPETAKLVDINLVAKTLSNPQLEEVLSGKVYKEQPFMLSTTYRDLHYADSDEQVILQGVLDLVCVKENSAVIIDFKYSSRSDEELVQLYSSQLYSYRLAVSKILNTNNIDCYIFSIKHNKLIKA